MIVDDPEEMKGIISTITKQETSILKNLISRKNSEYLWWTIKSLMGIEKFEQPFVWKELQKLLDLELVEERTLENIPQFVDEYSEQSIYDKFDSMILDWTGQMNDTTNKEIEYRKRNLYRIKTDKIIFDLGGSDTVEIVYSAYDKDQKNSLRSLMNDGYRYFLDQLQRKTELIYVNIKRNMEENGLTIPSNTFLERMDDILHTRELIKHNSAFTYKYKWLDRNLTIILESEFDKQKIETQEIEMGNSEKIIITKGIKM